MLACVSAIALALLFSSSAAPAGAADPASTDSTSIGAAASAVAWLKTQQQPDGGFEVASFAGFETRDVVLAIAEQAQTTTTWTASAARTAVEALQAGGSGPTPLDYLEDLVAASNDPGVAAKTVVLVSEPLGIDPTAFGAVNLQAKMGGCSGLTSPTFNGLLYLIIAQQLSCNGAPAASVTAVRAAQQANGGWGFVGDPTADDIDNDTTALAVEALVGSGALPSDPAVRAALGFLAHNHQANGAWQSFGEDDPNSTAMAILAITAAGYDVRTPCWRDAVAPALAGTPYTSPDVWLRSRQLTTGADAGRVQSPSDSFGINTLPTSQAVEGLLRSWLPVARAAAQVCTTAGSAPSVSTSAPTAGGTITVSGDGFAPGASLTIELHSDAVVLATVTADVTGAYSATVTIPADTAAGAHEIVVAGLGPDGQPTTSVVTIDVRAAVAVEGAVAAQGAVAVEGVVAVEQPVAVGAAVVSVQPTFTG